MISVGRRAAALGLAAAVGMVAACSSPRSAAPPTPSTPSPQAVSSTPTSSPRATSTTPARTTAAPAGQLPGDLTPNVVEDECLLATVEFGALTGRTPVRAENTELAGGGRRSCFYVPDAAAGSATDDPAARIDVYASASLPPPELVARIAANGGHGLAGIGQGAVVVTGSDGTFELVVASATLLAVLTVLPSGTTTPPQDPAWTAAGTAIASRLPR